VSGCYAASVKLAEQNPEWRVAIGYFDTNPFDPLFGWMPHAWNLLPDGRIYDTTSDQFGIPAPAITDQANPCYVADPFLSSIIHDELAAR
jgi:hypothetical protein